MLSQGDLSLPVLTAISITANSEQHLLCDETILLNFVLEDPVLLFKQLFDLKENLFYLYFILLSVTCILAWANSTFLNSNLLLLFSLCLFVLSVVAP